MAPRSALLPQLFVVYMTTDRQYVQNTTNTVQSSVSAVQYRASISGTLPNREPFIFFFTHNSYIELFINARTSAPLNLLYWAGTLMIPMADFDITGKLLK
eukprot:gb/GECG01005610.1/.p1 GENE.gb/GECG01005610.1/~~gb/GECG01005610.1/.p1  ORF type:complete len:100 (+),score=6.77 gb/GECG01005610.1/:1-300(+)